MTPPSETLGGTDSADCSGATRVPSFIDAYRCVRQNNSSIPDDALDPMKAILLTGAPKPARIVWPKARVETPEMTLLLDRIDVLDQELDSHRGFAGMFHPQKPSYARVREIRVEIATLERQYREAEHSANPQFNEAYLAAYGTNRWDWINPTCTGVTP